MLGLPEKAHTGTGGVGIYTQEPPEKTNTIVSGVSVYMLETKS